MKSRQKTMIFLICYFAYTSIYVARLNLSMASPGLIEEGILNTVQIGMMGSIFSIIYAFGRFMNGQLSDRKAPWFMISAGLLAAGASNLLIGFFPPFPGILFLWGVNAWAQSMLWGSVLSTIAVIYDEETAKRKTTYLATTVAVGNIIAIVLNTWLLEQFHVRFAFVIPGGLTLLFATLVVLSMRKIEPAGADSKEHIPVKELLQDREMQITIFPAVFHGVMKDNISLWMAVYFVDQFGINLKQSAAFVMLIPVTGLVGRLLYPPCYRLCKGQEHKVSLYSFLFCIGASLVMSLGTVPPLGAAVFLSMIYTAISLINTSLLSMYPLRYTHSGNVASVSGIMDFATYFGAGVSSFCYGFLIDRFGYGPMYLSWVAVSFLSVLCLRRLIGGAVSDR